MWVLLADDEDEEDDEDDESNSPGSSGDVRLSVGGEGERTGDDRSGDGSADTERLEPEARDAARRRSDRRVGEDEGDDSFELLRLMGAVAAALTGGTMSGGGER